MRKSLAAADLVDQVLDPGTYVSWDTAIDLADLVDPRNGADTEYVAELEAAQQRSGVDEAVLTGRGSIHGHDVAVIVGEFLFLGGSIGQATARRIVDAVHRATRERLPLIAATSSGGTRMQEGTPAFVEMITISRAVVAHKAAGLPYLVYLRHPTMGGVFASWASLGHVTVAEPGALIGFLGPRVYEALHGQPFPVGVQVAENLVAKGIIDAIVPSHDLASVASRVLCLLSAQTVPTSRTLPLAEADAPPAQLPPPDRTNWESVLATRAPDRPGVRELLKYAADDVIPLSGSGDGELDAGLMLALTSFEGISCVLVGQDRRHQVQRGSMGPAALRSARRGMRLADELGLPLVTVVDTPGADLSPQAEEGALAGEIARCLADMSSLSVPSVAILLGQGCGGGALALLAGDRVIAAEHGWLSPLPPEGASAIVYHDSEHAPEMAERQRIGARELLTAGIVDLVVPERPEANRDPQRFAQTMVGECARQLRELTRIGAKHAGHEHQSTNPRLASSD